MMIRTKMGLTRSKATIETKEEILYTLRKQETWYKCGTKHQSEEIAIYTAGSVMQFAMDDHRLPVDIEENAADYLLCIRRFGPEKKLSRTELTSVWFSKKEQG